MPRQTVLAVDLANVYEQPGRKGLLHTLAWGDQVEVVEATDEHLRINTVTYEEQADGSILPVKKEAFISPPRSARMAPADLVVPRNQNRVLKVNFVDVQQGDGAVIETPDGKVVLVDGGDNQLFARYLAARFRGTSLERPKEIECILVTHGDADHFEGLTEIFKSEQHAEALKRLFITPKRVYHNGLVKRPSKRDGRKVPDKELLGPTREAGGATIITGLVDSLLDVPDDEMNLPFRSWKEALQNWNARSPIEFRRLSFGDDDAFDFMAGDDMELGVLGPFLTEQGNVKGLKFLGNPPKGPRIGHESLEVGEEGFKGFSASHTINGHSIVFRLRYGGFGFLFSGDLNDEASRALARKHQRGEINLRSEVFKVPHHGSADFSGAFVKMVSPIVSVVSSGDESAKVSGLPLVWPKEPPLDRTLCKGRWGGGARPTRPATRTMRPCPSPSGSHAPGGGSRPPGLSTSCPPGPKPPLPTPGNARHLGDGQDLQYGLLVVPLNQPMGTCRLPGTEVLSILRAADQVKRQTAAAIGIASTRWQIIREMADQWWD